MPVPLADSPNLVPIPEIDLANAVVLEDSSPFSSWEEMFTQHPGKLDSLLSPGDYRDWGPLEIPDDVRPADGRPRTVRYHAPGVDDMRHPVKRSGAARVASLKLEGPLTRNWLVRGLTVTRPTADCVIQGGACNVTVDFCLIDHPRLRG
jgi:hypothetical protein